MVPIEILVGGVLVFVFGGALGACLASELVSKLANFYIEEKRIEANRKRAMEDKLS